MKLLAAKDDRRCYKNRKICRQQITKFVGNFLMFLCGTMCGFGEDQEESAADAAKFAFYI